MLFPIYFCLFGAYHTPDTVLFADCQGSCSPYTHRDRVLGVYAILYRPVVDVERACQPGGTSGGNSVIASYFLHVILSSQLPPFPFLLPALTEHSGTAEYMGNADTAQIHTGRQFILASF
jgi:hypothetical protein